MNINKYDLTEGGILKKLIAVALPIIGTQVTIMVYNMTDMFWLGRLGADSVAASGTAGMYTWLSMSLMILGSTGAEIGIAQNFGRKDYARAQQYAQNCVMLELALGLLTCCVYALFSTQLIGIYKIEDTHVAAAAAAYLRISSFGLPFFFVRTALKGMFIASGNSRLPLLTSAVGVGLNIAIDPLFIFTFQWGVEGAAAASIVAQSVECLLLVLAVKRHRDRPFQRFTFFAKPNLGIMKRAIRRSLPLSLENMFFASISMIVTRAISGFGTEALAVARVGGQVESLSWLIFGGFSGAVTHFTGQNYGARQWKRIQTGFRISAAIMFSWGLVVALLLTFFGYQLFGIFIKDPLIQSMGATYLSILALSQIPGCVEAFSAGALRGVGKTLPSSIVSISSNILRVVLVYTLSAGPLGLNGVWWSSVTATMMRGVLVFTIAAMAIKKQTRTAPVLDG